MNTPKKGGRPPLGRARKQEYRITLRCNTVCNFKLRALARAAGITRTEVLRQLILNGSVRERLREPDRTQYEIYDAIKECLPKCRNWNELEGRLKEQGINVRYKFCGSTSQKQGVLFSKNGLEFSGSKVDRAFSFSKLDRHFGQVQQRHTTLMSGLKAATGSFRAAFAGLFGGGRPFSAAGGGGGGGSHGAGSVSLDSAGSIPLPPFDSPFALSPEMMQRREGESPEEHIARITALINKAAEAMAIALMERKRRMEARSRKIG